MDKFIVYDKELSKADALVLKTLEADIRDVSAKKPLSDGVNQGNGDTKIVNGSTTPSSSPILDRIFLPSSLDLFPPLLNVTNGYSQARPSP